VVISTDSGTKHGVVRSERLPLASQALRFPGGDVIEQFTGILNARSACLNGFPDFLYGTMGRRSSGGYSFLLLPPIHCQILRHVRKVLAGQGHCTPYVPAVIVSEFSDSVH